MSYTINFRNAKSAYYEAEHNLLVETNKMLQDILSTHPEYGVFEKDSKDNYMTSTKEYIRNVYIENKIVIKTDNNMYYLHEINIDDLVNISTVIMLKELNTK